MAAAGEYILSVTGAAILCSAVLALVQGTAYHNILRLICGIFVTFIALNPVIDFEMPNLETYLDRYLREGEAAASYGDSFSREALSERIKEETRAYILDKAASMGLSLDVDVIVTHDDVPIPVYVRISGSVTPREKAKIERFLVEELGITKENQQWIP